MRRATRVTTVLAAALALTMAVGANAIAATKPDPLKVAQSYMATPKLITQKVPLKTRPTPGGKVVFLQQGNGPNIAAGQMVKQGADAIGWSYSEVPYNGSDGASIAGAIQTALTQKPTVILAPVMVAALLNEATKRQLLAAKVPLVIGLSCPVVLDPPVFPGSALCPNEIPQARSLANWFIADSKGKGTILLETMPQFTTFVAFRDAFMSEVKRNCPGCTVENVEVTLTQYGQNQIPAILVNKLRANPSIQYLLLDNGLWVKGVPSALAAAGLDDRVKVGTRAIDELSYAELKAGRMLWGTAIPYGTWGLGTLDSALRVVTKSSGITGNSVMPMQLVTTANVGSIPWPYINAPLNALDQYKRLWRVR